MNHHPRLSNGDLEEISLILEGTWGSDSIATIETHYDGACVFPGCDTRGTPVALWKHVHFGRKHGRSFDVAWNDLGWDLVANIVNPPEPS